MLNNIYIKRLAFIKFLYKVAVEQSFKAEPLCSASILFFHDSIELFLQLASEHLDTGKSKPAFMDYWDLLKQTGKELTQKESMRRLNNARVALKHHGTQPSKFDIEGFRVSATNFFEENALLIFGINFSDLSLIDFIQCEAAKSSLREAVNLVKKNNIEDSLDKISVAFDQLIMDYEKRKTKMFGHSPFFFGKSSHLSKTNLLSRLNRRGIDVDKKLTSAIDRALDAVSDELMDEIEVLKSAIKIISLGIDYRKYAKFRIFTPNVSWAMDGSYYIYRYKRELIPKSEDVQFCIDFVIESAITLHEFDFTLNGHRQ
jgi:hypothetical protein